MSFVNTGTKHEDALIKLLEASDEAPMSYSRSNVIDIDLPLRMVKIEVKSIRAQKGKKKSDLLVKKMSGPEYKQLDWLMQNIATLYDLWYAVYFPYTGWRFYQAAAPAMQHAFTKHIFHADEGITYDGFLATVRENVPRKVQVGILATG